MEEPKKSLDEHLADLYNNHNIWNTANQIGDWYGTAAISPLTDMLLKLANTEGDTLILKVAVGNALVRIGEPILLELARILPSANSHSLALMIISIMMEVGKPAVPYLKNAFISPNDYVRWAAARQIADFSEADFLPQLIELLRDEESGVRFVAAGALIKLADKRAVPALLNALLDPESIVNNRAAEALRKIAKQHLSSGEIWQLESSGEVALLRLIENLKTRDRAEWQRIVTSLKTIGVVAQSTMRIALNHEHPSVREAAALVLGAIKDQVSLPILIKMLHDPDAYARAGALMALEEIGTPEALAAVEQWRREQENS